MRLRTARAVMSSSSSAVEHPRRSPRALRSEINPKTIKRKEDCFFSHPEGPGYFNSLTGTRETGTGPGRPGRHARYVVCLNGTRVGVSTKPSHHKTRSILYIIPPHRWSPAHTHTLLYYPAPYGTPTPTPTLTLSPDLTGLVRSSTRASRRSCRS